MIGLLLSRNAIIAYALLAYGLFAFVQGAQHNERKHLRAVVAVNKLVKTVNDRETQLYIKRHGERVKAFAEAKPAITSECRLTAEEAQALRRIR